MTSSITTATNFDTPDISSAVDSRKYFNNFYAKPFEIGPAGDAIVGFFEQRIPNKSAAKNLASVVIYTSLAQNLNPMETLNQFKQLQPGELNNYLTAFLNINRAPTSFLGFRDSPPTNNYVQRTILA